ERGAYRRSDQDYAFDIHHFAFRVQSRLNFAEPKQLSWQLFDLPRLEGQADFRNSQVRVRTKTPGHSSRPKAAYADGHKTAKTDCYTVA
ncbi:MAG: hypothetical protein KBT84_10815, partial [Pseudomonas sp.]|nr:hypothetical protein [Pseudomonas sp.]